MNKISSFYTSSVGRKLSMGLTGFFLCSFLIVHLYLNLFLLKQDRGSTFDTYADFMATYPLVRPLEIILFAGFLLHAFIGVWLWISNRLARPVKYAVNRPGENSTLASRTAFWTGVFVFIFLVVHVNTFFISSRFFPDGMTMYDRVYEAFQSPLYVCFYLVALAFLAYHLKHGVQSAFQTLGLRHRKYEALINATAVFFWLMLPAAFAVLPLYFLLAH